MITFYLIEYKTFLIKTINYQQKNSKQKINNKLKKNK